MNFRVTLFSSVLPLILVVLGYLPYTDTTHGAPRLVFQGVEVPEHSLVVREAIGTFNDGTLMCVTDYRPCCVADIRSTWMWPSGRVVPYHPNARGIGVVRLHRNTLGASGKGIMMCRIRVSAGDGSQNFKFLLVGVYSRIQHVDSTPEDGSPVLTCTSGTPFQLISDPEDVEPQFTLSCTSSGGPVRGFSCTNTDTAAITTGKVRFRNNRDNREKANYDLSATVTGNYPGRYACQVTVHRFDGVGVEPEILTYPGIPGPAQTITVAASDPPTGLTGVRVITDEGTYAIRITWTPPLDPPTTIYGYRICYHNGTLPVETVVVRGGSVTSYDLAVNPLAHYNIKMQTLFTAKLPSGISVALHSEATTLLPVPSVSVTADPDRIVYTGESITLTCEVTVDPAIRTEITVSGTWYGPRGKMISDCTIVTHLVYHCTLNLSSLSLSDSGDYVCAARVEPYSPSPLVNPSEEGVSQHTITVEDYTVSITGSGNPALGGTYTLLCAVEGVTGSPTIHWLGPREITTVEPARNLTSILTLSNLTLSDAGEYTCRSTLSGVERVTVLVLMLQIRPELTVSHDGGSGTIYAGSALALTCVIGLPSSVLPVVDLFSVTAEWTGLSNGDITSNGRVTVHPPHSVAGSTAFLSVFEFNTLLTTDSDTYTCTAAVGSTGELPLLEQQASMDISIAVIAPTVNVTVETNTTRFPAEAPFNTFTILCTASAPGGVIAAKTIGWLRTAEPGSDKLYPVAANGSTISRETSDLTRATSTGRLTVTEESPGDYQYRCQVDIPELAIRITTEVQPIVVTGPVTPVFTDLNATVVPYEGAIIEWTVPVITYTPETYVVHYGTGRDVLHHRSTSLSSGNDFEAKNLSFRALLTDLNFTDYFYQLVATNSFGSTFSNVRTLSLAPGSPPLDFTVTANGPRDLTFSWGPPVGGRRVGDITGYLLSCEPQPEGFPKTYDRWQFTDGGGVVATETGFTPSSTYNCSVLASNVAGNGPAVSDTAITPDDFMLFQLQITGVHDCRQWAAFATLEKLEDIRLQLQAKIEELCGCGFTASHHLSSGEFQCLSQPDEVTYRGRLSGTTSTSSGDIVAQLEEWVWLGEATVVIQGLRLPLDSSCQPVTIKSFDDPECAEEGTVEIPTTHLNETPVARPPEEDSSSGADITTMGFSGGVAAAIVLLIIAIIVTVVVIVALVRRHQRSGHDHTQSEREEWSKAVESSFTTTECEAYGVTYRPPLHPPLPPPPSPELQHPCDRDSHIYEVPTFDKDGYATIGPGGGVVGDYDVPNSKEGGAYDVPDSKEGRAYDVPDSKERRAYDVPNNRGGGVYDDIHGTGETLKT